MKKPLMVFAVMVMAALCTSANDQQHKFDLKGDVLGESLATFKAKHPDAECLEAAPSQTCHQSDAGFAGRSPCHSEKENCGLGADFRNGRLIYLSYNVSADEPYHTSLFDLLAAKFGKPTTHNDGATLEVAKWDRKNEVLWLVFPKNESRITVELEQKKPADKDDL